ncbi:hypothetical protein [Burkholderia thailandensis]|uniref:Glycosyl hydrolase family 32 N-terminal domain-containing protein n=1 Tax=Burkholderia thailandensis (strain ATCC 700388 / DSM 13276 / CCUG 48851 / CIP 106301 / E264) TaxID=271848 RepID=Q2STP0_BURTA|nr:hypothetical protein [Burkholderia thailandensis]ABC38630.1 conserved hypothetical protein [Burkholderia thailandensis E264]AHI74383.1 hypothetical protein BTQ_3156 [Burkholderia thailandensis 2002721723]AHI80004.1 hypothetical protein BTJ_2539 [Burkholderia thailandensis E444]AIC87940.1 hypothetical protein BTRA_658 [Burkholderia thailandensis USAMRU Malaysia \
MAGIHWEKRGLVYTVDARLPWATSHAQIPTAAGVKGDALRLLFSSRDADNRSGIARLDVRAGDPSQVLDVKADPVLPPGALGAFDDCGTMPSSVVERDGVHYLYYIGWNVRNTIPYHNAVGLAISEDGGETYRRLFEGPVMDRTAEEPYFCGTTCVRIENGIWRNWYLACTGWSIVAGKPEPRYHLKYAESRDGIHWERTGRIAIDYLSDDEGGLARASVHHDGSRYRMWFCKRSHTAYRENSSVSYRMGYAESADGIVWDRMDEEAALDVSETGWDAFMVAYPEVVEIGGRLYLFYNGNGFGATGFGYAEAACHAGPR